MNLSFKLSDEFLDAYKSRDVDWGYIDAAGNSLGEVTFLRTYSRLKEDGSKERWWEVCRRVIEGMYALQKDHAKTNRLPWNDHKAQRSAQEAFERLFSFKWTPPGRGLWMMGTPLVMEQRNSAALQNCFGPDTRVITSSGIERLADLVGGQQEVWTEQGWEKAEFHSFGRRAVQRITFAPFSRRSNVRVTEVATPDHRWVLRDGTVTENLKVGDVIPAQAPLSDPAPSEGFKHGLIFGDGSLSYTYANGDFSHIMRLCGDKARYADIFDNVHLQPNCNGDPVVYHRSATNMKRLPQIQDPSYLSDFISGWGAMDGNWRAEGVVVVSTQQVEAAQWLLNNAVAGGWIVTGYNQSSVTETNYGPRSAPLIRVTLARPDDQYWIVRAIDPLDEEEEVYCATVAATGTFTLASGILTGNCAYVSTGDMTKTNPSWPFCFLMEASMLGIGVGFDTKGAERGFIIHEPDESKAYTHIIQDSREGWFESLQLIIESYLIPGKAATYFDYTLIRPAGSAIKTFGGTAPGPSPLMRLHRKIRGLFAGRDGHELTSKDIADIGNLIGVCVVSGNVRRSAELLIGNLDDKEFLQLKNPEAYPERNRYSPDPDESGWGWMSNNSVSVGVGDDLTGIVDGIALNGEPGVIWMDIARKYGRLIDGPNNKDWRVQGFNPCAEQSLESQECCVVSSTLIHTRSGVIHIGDVVGQSVEVWNGEDWSTVTPFSSGRLPVIRVTFSDGSYLDATPGHEWIARRSAQRSFKTFRTSDLEVGMVLPEFELANLDGKLVDNSYTWGWFAGDGYMDGSRPMALVQASEYEVILDELGGHPYPEQWGPRGGQTRPFRRVSLKGVVPEDVGYALRNHEAGLPDAVMSMDVQSIRRFMGGWIDSDGSVVRQENTDHLLLYGDEQKLRDAQILLRRIGVNHATLRRFAQKGDETNKGVRRQDLWRLLIPSYEAGEVATLLKTAMKIGVRHAVNPRYSQTVIDRARKQKIVSIERISEEEETFCFNEPINHMGVFGNVLTKQCTLVETYLNRHESLDDFKRTLKFAYLYAKTVTLLPTHWPQTNAIMQRNRRIGCSVSGLANFTDNNGMNELKEWLNQGYNVVQYYDKKYSEWLCVRESIKTTTVKPSGCRPWDALTTTDQGILTLEEMFAASHHIAGEEWQSFDGYSALQGDGSSPITKTFDNGKAEVFSVSLSYGMEVRSTGNHQWWVSRHYDHSMTQRWADVGEWVRTDALCPGDVLEIKPGVYTSNTEASLLHLDARSLSMRGDATEILQPSAMTPDLGWLLGYLWGDGAMSPGKYRVRFIDAISENLQKAQRILWELFGLRAEIRPASGARKAQILEVGSKMLWHWLIKNGVWKYFAEDIDFIPEVVRRSSTESVLAFLAGLIDADGHVATRTNENVVILATASSAFARHLQGVALAAGIVFGRSHNTGGESKQKQKSMWLMCLAPETLPERLDLMECHSTKMANRLRSELPWSPHRRGISRTRILGKVNSVESIGQVATFDIEVGDTHWYYDGGVKSHNTVSILAGESPGVHWTPGGEYFNRALRFDANDPMLVLFANAGYKVEIDVANPESTMVVYFPIRSKARRSEKQVSLFEKANLAVLAQRYWSDNSVSVTLSFDAEKEADYVGTVLHMHEGQLKTVSFLPMGNEVYPQQPYTQITDEGYEAAQQSLEKIDLNAIYKSKGEEAVGEAYCTTDVCMVKLY